MRADYSMNVKEVYTRIKQLFKEIHSKEIREAARKAGDRGSWTRKRYMPLSDILICTLAKKGLSAVMEIRHYFQAVEKVGQTVSKQDYLKQRQKLNPEVFKLLNRNYLKRFYGGQEVKGWRGYLVLAEDGSRAEIPNSEENRRVYGESINKYGKAVARTNINSLYDVENRFILDIGIHDYRSSEIADAKEHITALKEITGGRKALIIFDRNYASLEFIDFLEKTGIFYLIRLHSTDYKEEIERMQGSDEEVKITHNKSRMGHLRRSMPKRGCELVKKGSTSVRVIKTKFPNGEQGIFATNLREGSAWEIIRLYRKRWSIEKKYHTLKNKLKFESVTGKASIYVQQDFWAQMLVFNIVQDLITAAEIRAVKKSRKKRYRYAVRINENIAIGLFKEQFIKLIMEEDDSIKDAMFSRLITDMERYIVPVRNNQKSSPRKWKYFNKYKCNQKPSF
jgi:hypothetical protein